MTTTDEVSGIIGEYEADVTAHDPIDQTISEPKAEGEESGSSTTESEAENTNTNTQTESETESNVTGQSEEGQTQTTETSTEDAHSKTETENKEDFSNWADTLPPPPEGYQGKEPEFDPDTGQITNMTPAEYVEYIEGRATAAIDDKTYRTQVETKALEVAEQILPDLRSNTGVRQMVENTRIASILSGNPMDTVQAALNVREALGISPEKIQAAKTEGANQTKASITIQKNAALETGSTQTGPDSDQVGELQKRVKRGDDEAFVELLGLWEQDGKLK